jgi:uncharacterized protein YuzE
MKLEYFADTNTLYFEFADGPASDTEVLVEGLVADFDAKGQIIGLEIDNWQHTDLSSVVMQGFAHAATVEEAPWEKPS